MIIPTSHDMYPVLVVGCVIMVLMVVILITLFGIKKKLGRPERDEAMKILRDQHERLQNRYVSIPQKKAASFKAGDRVRCKIWRENKIGVVYGEYSAGIFYVKYEDVPGCVTIPARDLELISKENEFKVGDRVRRKSDGKEGFVTMLIPDGILIVDFRIVSLERYAVQLPEELELICEKQS